MDAVILTWRWQNLLSIWLMVIVLALIAVAIRQATLGKSKADAGQSRT